MAVSILLMTMCAVSVYGVSDRQRVPRVRYILPEDDSTVDLTGKESLTFSWKGQPKPSGGRRTFRFSLYKGFGYGAVFTKDLDRDVYSVGVPADIFEDGAVYSWSVKQRDASNMFWSLFDSRSFKVVKKQ